MRKKYIAIDGTSFKTKKKAKRYSKKLIEAMFSFDYNRPVDDDKPEDKFCIDDRYDDFYNYAVDKEDTIDSLYRLIEFCIKKNK